MSVGMKLVHGKPHGACLHFREGIFLVGRAPECHIRPNSELVSPRHCLLRVHGHHVHVQDLGSANGTFVNGNLLQGEREVVDGDVLQLGPVVLQIVQSEDGKVSVSSGSLAILSGMGLTLRGADGDAILETARRADLRITPERPIIIGRAEDASVPYLDPTYRATTLLPDTAQTSVLGDGPMTDKYVSRGHFMLRAHAGGVLLVNGVPHCRGGGLRPPVNGTRLLAPARRPMTPNEEYLIERGAEIVLALPNGSQVQIDAR